jgi:GTPase
LRKVPAVVIVGRPNVGKSTLFNRITGSRRAIVAPVAGTTRDVFSKNTIWRGTSFDLFDTGGLYGASEDPLHDLVVRHGRRAIQSAALLVFVTDGREGLVPADLEIAADIRQTGRPFWRSTRPTTSGREMRRLSSIGWDSSRSSRFPRNTDRASPTCWTRSSRRWEDWGLGSRD